MANAFTDYEGHGPADPRASRRAAVVDLGIGTLLAVLVWPFPVARILLTDATGSVALGWVVHVAMLLAFATVMDWAYTTVSVGSLGRTVGMYFNDLGPDGGRPAWSAALSLGASWVGAGVAGLFTARAAEGVARARLVSTRTPS